MSEEEKKEETTEATPTNDTQSTDVPKVEGADEEKV